MNDDDVELAQAELKWMTRALWAIVALNALSFGLTVVGWMGR